MKGPESAVIETAGVHHIVRGLAVGSLGMSFFAFLVWWWVPFGFLVACAAAGMAVVSILMGVRTKAQGLHYPLGAIALAVLTTNAALVATKFANVAFLEL